MQMSFLSGFEYLSNKLTAEASVAPPPIRKSDNPHQNTGNIILPLRFAAVEGVEMRPHGVVVLQRNSNLIQSALDILARKADLLRPFCMKAPSGKTVERAPLLIKAYRSVRIVATDEGKDKEGEIIGVLG